MRSAYRFKTRQADQSRNILRTLHMQASMPGISVARMAGSARGHAQPGRAKPRKLSYLLGTR